MCSLDRIQLSPFDPPFCVTDKIYCSKREISCKIKKFPDKKYEIRESLKDTLLFCAWKEKDSLFIKDVYENIVLQFETKTKIPLNAEIFKGNGQNQFIGNAKREGARNFSVKVTLSAPYKNESCLVVKGVNGSKEIAMYLRNPVATLRFGEDSQREITVAPNVDLLLIVAISIGIGNSVKT